MNLRGAIAAIGLIAALAACSGGSSASGTKPTTPSQPLPPPTIAHISPGAGISGVPFAVEVFLDVKTLVFAPSTLWRSCDAKAGLWKPQPAERVLRRVRFWRRRDRHCVSVRVGTPQCRSMSCDVRCAC